MKTDGWKFEHLRLGSSIVFLKIFSDDNIISIVEEKMRNFCKEHMVEMAVFAAVLLVAVAAATWAILMANGIIDDTDPQNLRILQRINVAGFAILGVAIPIIWKKSKEKGYI